MQAFNASLTRPLLDTTLILDTKQDDDKGQCPLFALVSLNYLTAPSLEVPWSQLLALSISPEKDPAVLSVGRHKDCSVQLSDPRVSLHHFEIAARRKPIQTAPAERLEYDCFLNDLSSNGTAVNGKTVGKGTTQQLRSGDEICVLPTHKVGQDKRIAFVFRNTTEALTASSEVKQLDLDELVICPICMQPIYKCVALMPCFHNYCMACYSEWMVRKDECPVCRQNVSAVIKNHAMDAVIEAFLEAFPERRRSKAELQDMDDRDKLKLGAGGKVVKDICAVAPVGTFVPANTVMSAVPAATPAAPPSGQALTPGGVPATASTTPGPTTGAESVRARIGTQVCSIQ